MSLYTNSIKCSCCKEYVKPLKSEDNYLVCPKCGAIISEEYLIDPHAEWRAYSNEQRIRRERATPCKVPGTDLKKTFGKIPRDHRVRVTSIDSETVRYRREIERISSLLNLPQWVTEGAKIVFEKARKNGLLKGRNAQDFVAASIYAVCKSSGNKVICNLNNLSHCSEAEKRNILRAYKILIKENIIKPVIDNNPLRYIPLILSRLKTKKEIQPLIINFIREIRKSALAQGRNPRSIAAAAVYIVLVMMNERLRQTDVAKAADIAPPTLRRTLEQLSSDANIYIHV